MRRAIGGVIGLLALVGVITGLGRVVRSGLGIAPSPAMAARLVAFDSTRVERFADAGRLPAGPRRDQLRADVAELEGKYTVHAAAILLHAIPGTLFMLLAPLQLARRVRSRYPGLHRWSGRVLLLAAVVLAGPALYIVWLAPHAGARETLVVTPVAVLFLVSGARAWAAIRRGDVTTHREWMLRFLAIGLGISTVRLISFPVAILLPTMNFRSAFVLTLWLGWGSTLGIAEWWIRHTRPEHRDMTLTGARGLATAPAAAR